MHELITGRQEGTDMGREMGLVGTDSYGPS
jgi:hypothetical protein